MNIVEHGGEGNMVDHEGGVREEGNMVDRRVTWWIMRESREEGDKVDCEGKGDMVYYERGVREEGDMVDHEG